MVKKLKAGSNRLRTVYWSAVGMLSMMLISLQPVLAAKDKGGGDTIWNRFSTIMKDYPWLQYPEIRQTGLHEASNGTGDDGHFDHGLPATGESCRVSPDWL